MKANHTLPQGWQPYGTRAQNCKRKNFLGTWHSLLFQLSPPPAFARSASLFVTNMCICTHMAAYRLYMNDRCYRIILQVKHFYTNLEHANC